MNGSNNLYGLHGHEIKYVQNMDDENFGNIDIYNNGEGKYIMMVKRTFMKEDNISNTYNSSSTTTKKH